MLQFSNRFAFFNELFVFKTRTPKITRILTLYQANAATLTLFGKEDKILIKNLCECKGYNARQFIIKFSDKSWTKNSINGEVKKVLNSRHVNRQFLRVIFVTFGDVISDEYYLSTRKLCYSKDDRAMRAI